MNDDTFGKRLYALRLEKSWSLGRLAELSGIATHTLSLMEQDKHKPQRKSIEKLALAFGIEPKNLASEDEMFVPVLRQRMLAANAYVLQFEDGAFYIADDEEPTDDVNKAVSYHNAVAAKLEADIVSDMWGELATPIPRKDAVK